MKKLISIVLLAVLACLNGVTAGESLPEKGAASSVPAARWEEAFATGNGRMGAMLFGDPENETLIANHCRLFLPLGSYETVPDLAAQLPELRRIFRQDGANAAMTFLMAKAAEQGFPGIIATDPFHPGLFVHLRQPSEGGVRDYLRTEDFRTGEVAVRWKDGRGSFCRRLFVSRPHNVIAFAMTCEREGQITCDLEFPIPSPTEKTPIGDKGWRAGITADLLLPHRTMSRDLVAFHNIYGRGKGGFDVAIRIVVQGGRANIVDDRLRIAEADGLLLLIRIVPWKTPLPPEASDAWPYSAENPDFIDHAGRFDPVPELNESSVVPYRTVDDTAALLPQLVQSLETLETDYDALFVPHRKLHADLFDRVSIDLGGGEDRAKTSEELLAVAVREKRLPAALAEKIYDGGRYMLICSAGELPPNLQGIWTGSWRPAWSGDFTLDTNIQLAMKHAYTADLGELMKGYFRMIEGFYPEWRLNAKRTYGCPGYLTNARASNTALLLHWGKWPGIFWTGGCGWLAHFFYDHWQFTGDEKFLKEQTVPLLKEIASFYEAFVVLDPSTGRYEFIPSYSPETGAGITSTMDVMATGESMYANMMCSHEPNARIFNCDANGAMPEIMHRMILQSHPGVLNLLPALPKAWPQGEIRGIKARQQITISRLAWNAKQGHLTLRLTSEKDQKIVLRLPRAESIRRIEVTGGTAVVQPTEGHPNQRSIAVKADETVALAIDF